MNTTHYLAIDLGADSGRLMLGTLAGENLTLEELHRFPNTPIKTGGAMHWNIDQIWSEIKAGLKKAAQRNLPYASISCDSWGVDYLLFGRDGSVNQPTFHYRDARNPISAEKVKARLGWAAIFAETGIQFLPFNTIFQLAAETPERLAQAHQMLCIGDAFNFFLSGVAKSEESLASTTQLYNPVTKQWSQKLLQALGLPPRIFTPIVPSGSVLGPLTGPVARETGLKPIQVIASCSHDTGAAVAAVPGAGKNWAYLSSGTWSLMGVELPKPVVTDQCRDLNLTNEIGFGGSARLLKNIIGLWLVQECRREWAKAGQSYDFATLEKMATAAPAFMTLVNASDARYLSPDGMPEKIAAQCKEAGQPVPANPGAMVRAIYEGLALLYRRTLGKIERLIGQKIEGLHVVGGGSKDALLNQFAADALQIPVMAGPVEATALGNVVVQAIAMGHLPSLDKARDIIRTSLAVKTFQPKEASAWEAAYQRFEKTYPE